MARKDFSKRLEHRWKKKQLREELKTREALQKMEEEMRQIRPFINVFFKGIGVVK